MLLTFLRKSYDKKDWNGVFRKQWSHHVFNFISFNIHNLARWNFQTVVVNNLIVVLSWRTVVKQIKIVDTWGAFGYEERWKNLPLILLLIDYTMSCVSLSWMLLTLTCCTNFLRGLHVLHGTDSWRTGGRGSVLSSPIYWMVETMMV